MATSTPLGNFESPRRPPTRWPLVVLLGLLALLGIGVGCFWLVTVFAKPAVMQITMPKAEATKLPEAASANDLTFLLDGERVSYYVGPNTAAQPATLHPVTAAHPTQQILRAWQQQHDSARVFIRPTASVNYKHMVAMLDELNMAGQQHYGLYNITPADEQLLAAQGGK